RPRPPRRRGERRARCDRDAGCNAVAAARRARALRRRSCVRPRRPRSPSRPRGWDLLSPRPPRRRPRRSPDATRMRRRGFLSKSLRITKRRIQSEPRDSLLMRSRREPTSSVLDRFRDSHEVVMRSSVRSFLIASGAVGAFVLLTAASSSGPSDPGIRPKDPDGAITQHALDALQEGRQTFRFDTFGDEAFWGDTLRLHEAIEGAAHGGVGPGLSPMAALEAGLKVDVDALPDSLQNDLRHGRVNLDDPAGTLAILKLNAVVGVTGFFHLNGQLRSVGLQCAICRSVVDNSFAPGIGHRLDGWANRDLNVGAVINMAPDLSVVDTLLGVDDATTRQVLM